MRRVGRGRIPQEWNPWKVTTLGMLGVVGLGLVAGTVIAHYDNAPAPAAKSVARSVEVQSVRHVASGPTAGDIDSCNRYASAFTGNRTKETLTNALIGGAVGAGLGAAGGAIADGGSGAGKGAGIGGLLGVAAGTVYGLNQANQQSSQSAMAYRTCMKRRGFVE
jgi:hypothetical protein